MLKKQNQENNDLDAGKISPVILWRDYLLLYYLVFNRRNTSIFKTAEEYEEKT